MDVVTGSDATSAAEAPRADSLLEREQELATLRALLADLRSGTGGIALMEGEAGVGKSRLLGALREQAARAGVRVLSARAGELERGFPFGVVRQLFEPLLAEPDARERRLAGAAAPAAAVFDAVLDEPQATDASFASLHGLYWLAADLATEGPALLSVDDLHWCDPPSLRFLAYLVRRLEDLPVLVAGTLRTTEPGTDAASLGELVHDPATVAVRPRLLSEAAVAALIADLLGAEPAPAFAAACHRATGGNPLLLRQLLTTLRAERVAPDAAHVDVVQDIGPRAVWRSVLLRLARLADPASAVARAVAVLGESATSPAIAGLVGSDEETVGEAIAALARAEILRLDTPLDFVHPLVREAVYRELPPGERERLHAEAARMLLDAGAGGDAVATQLLASPPRGEAWAVDLLVGAAQEAVRRGAADSAAAYLQRALAEPPAPELRPSLLLGLGGVELTLGVSAEEHLRAAYAEARDPDARGRAGDLLTRCLLFSAPPEEAQAVARGAREGLPAGDEDLRDTLEALELFSIFFGAPDHGRAERMQALRDQPAGAGPGARMLASSVLWDWVHRDGTAEQCGERALDILRDDVLIEADELLFLCGAIHALVLAERPEAWDAWEAVQARNHRRGSIWAALSIAHWRGIARLHNGDLEEADSDLQATLEGMARWNPETGGGGTSWSVPFVAAILRERGDVPGAGRVLRGVALEVGADAELYWRASEVEQLLAEGRPEEALAAAEALEACTTRTENPAISPWRSLKARALDRLGRTDEAIALALAELPLARRWGAPGTVGRTLRVIGELEREHGITRLEEAVTVLEGSACKLERARALAALGGALRRARRPTEAREPLRRALELCDVCSASALAEHVRSELYASGARPRTEALSGVNALTASERRVADLAAEGQTNREIAQTLYVTPKTVEVHLSNAYRKLGIRSRRELAASLAGG